MFKKPFSFEGRIRRTEFGISYIIYVLVYLLIVLFKEGMDPQYAESVYVIFIPLIWFLWAQGAKRCHDRGNSGFYQIIPFYVLWLLFAEGEAGRNMYGLNPKEVGIGEEIDSIGVKED